MKALGYYAVVTGRGKLPAYSLIETANTCTNYLLGNKNESIDAIQKYEREYFATSRVFQ